MYSAHPNLQRPAKVSNRFQVDLPQEMESFWPAFPRGNLRKRAQLTLNRRYFANEKVAKVSSPFQLVGHLELERRGDFGTVGFS